MMREKTDFWSTPEGWLMVAISQLGLWSVSLGEQLDRLKLLFKHEPSWLEARVITDIDGWLPGFKYRYFRWRRNCQQKVLNRPAKQGGE